MRRGEIDKSFHDILQGDHVGIRHKDDIGIAPVLFVEVDQFRKSARFPIAARPLVRGDGERVVRDIAFGNLIAHFERENLIFFFDEFFRLFVQAGDLSISFVFFHFFSAVNDIAADELDQAIYDKKDERDIDERNQNKADPTEYVEIAYNCAQRLEIIDRIENDDLVKRVENGIDKVPDILQRVPQKIHVVFRKFSHTRRAPPYGGRMPPRCR